MCAKKCEIIHDNTAELNQPKIFRENHAVFYRTVREIVDQEEMAFILCTHYTEPNILAASAFV